MLNLYASSFVAGCHGHCSQIECIGCECSPDNCATKATNKTAAAASTTTLSVVPVAEAVLDASALETGTEFFSAMPEAFAPSMRLVLMFGVFGCAAAFAVFSRRKAASLGGLDSPLLG